MFVQSFTFFRLLGLTLVALNLNFVFAIRRDDKRETTKRSKGKTTALTRKVRFPLLLSSWRHLVFARTFDVCDFDVFRLVSAQHAACATRRASFCVTLQLKLGCVCEAMRHCASTTTNQH